MSAGVALSRDDRTLTVSIPLSFRRNGGRKQVLSPAGAPAWAPQTTRIDSTLVKALARAFRWRRLLENGVYVSIQDIADAEKINPSYLSRVLRLTLLAPDIVESMLDGRQTLKLASSALSKSFPVEWENQRHVLTAR